MSSKGSIFLTIDEEHCYEETNEMDGNNFRLYLEIDTRNIKYFEHDDDCLLVGIKGDSHIAKILRTCREVKL